MSFKKIASNTLIAVIIIYILLGSYLFFNQNTIKNYISREHN